MYYRPTPSIRQPMTDTAPVPAAPKPSGQYLMNEEETGQTDTFLAARQLPECLQDAVARYIVKKTGKDLADPVMLDRLRKAIVAQKDDYWKPQMQRSLQYTKGYRVLGYLAYHFPVYFMEWEHLLLMLARDGLLKKRMTVLDIGTGPGVVPLAVADFFSRLDGATADVFSVERSEEHIEAFLYLRDACVPKGGRVSLKPPVRADITAGIPAKIPEKIDLLVFSNVLNETGGGDIGKRAGLVMQYAERLAPDGSILIVEPAEENTSTRLRTLSLMLRKRGFTIHSPCSFVWGTNCTPDRCWSFTTQRPIRPTRLMEVLAAGDEPFRYINIDIKYSYVVLRRDGMTRHGYTVPPGSRVLRLSLIHRHVDKRINIIAAKMSENLGDKKTLVFRLCDGSSEKPIYAVVPKFHVTPENEAIVSAPYGTILEIAGVHVRYNPEHDAYNLLVSRNTGVTMPVSENEED